MSAEEWESEEELVLTGLTRKGRRELEGPIGLRDGLPLCSFKIFFSPFSLGSPHGLPLGLFCLYDMTGICLCLAVFVDQVSVSLSFPFA